MCTVNMNWILGEICRTTIQSHFLSTQFKNLLLLLSARNKGHSTDKLFRFETLVRRGKRNKIFSSWEGQDGEFGNRARRV